ncbi:MAG TPA: DsbE family thiol:disulfide interchange protein [Sulfuricella sp.]|nr:DsbE family thiol:disulfide interchange protein [Sulfuricella sp.]
MKRFLIPLAIFLVLVGFLGVGLRLDPHEVPSPLIGKLAPDFNLPLLSDASRHFSPAEMRGKVWLLNVWASWCTSCRQEHETLLELARRGVVPIYGMDYKDQPADAQGVLNQAGNPYVETVMDIDGRVGINFGVYGVPETYVIDKSGMIRYKLTGPLTPENLEGKILPLLKELQK